MVSDLFLCVVQSLLELSGQGAAFTALLFQLLLKAADTCFLRVESLRHLFVFYLRVLQLPTTKCKQLISVVFF